MQETEKLLEAVGNQRNITLYTIRRMGKTALIKHVFRHLQEESLVTPLYVDLMPTSNFDDLTKRLAEAVIRHFGTIQKGLPAKIKQLVTSLGAAISFDPLNGMPVVNLQLPGRPGK